MTATPRNKSAFIPALVTFVLVTGAILLAGYAATWILKKIVLPVLAVILGYAAARFVYKVRD
jgi:zinc transporter ZupT